MRCAASRTDSEAGGLDQQARLVTYLVAAVIKIRMAAGRNHAGAGVLVPRSWRSWSVRRMGGKIDKPRPAHGLRGDALEPRDRAISELRRQVARA